MDNFTPEQYDRFEAYRRYALPKQAVRKVYELYILCTVLPLILLSHSQVIQQNTGMQVSQPVAQIVAGFGKVFVGEIVEKGEKIARFHLCIAGTHVVPLPSSSCARTEGWTGSSITGPPP